MPETPCIDAGRGERADKRVLAAGELSSPLLTPDHTVAVMETMDRVRNAIGLRYPGE
ncbi:MAG: hypothetical protein ABIO67_01790 [Mycobacteriales bacterium]